MHFSTIHLTNYKNYTELLVRLNPSVNCFIGDNGAGKTNVLDAIYYSCIGKSFFANRDVHVVSHDCDFFRIDANLVLADENHNVVVKCKPGNSKHIEIDTVPLERLSDLPGQFPVVIISTHDDRIILDGSVLRRKFINNFIGQLDKDFLLNLSDYHKLLRQRNALLKSDRMSTADKKELALRLSSQMAPAAKYIFDQRIKWMPKINKSFKEMYAAISDRKEEVDIEYVSELHQKDFLNLVSESLQIDLHAKRTNYGIHKDDLNITMNGSSLRNFASQGQLKSTVIALKLAQFMILMSEKEQKPIILLDDIFDRLDRNRVLSLVRMLYDNQVGQVLITDTDKSRILFLLNELKLDSKMFWVQNGKVEVLNEET